MQLMWWRFRKHRVAVAAAFVVVAFYLVVLGADFLAYTNPNTTEAYRSLMPPQPIRFIDNGRFRPHVYAVSGERDMRTFKRVYVADPDHQAAGPSFLCAVTGTNFLALSAPIAI